jgi:hypothetical protein
VVKRLAIVAIAAAGIGLFGTGMRGIAALDGRLAEADDREPVVREVELKRELGAREDCPAHEGRDDPPPLPDERQL